MLGPDHPLVRIDRLIPGRIAPEQPADGQTAPTAARRPVSNTGPLNPAQLLPAAARMPVDLASSPAMGTG